MVVYIMTISGELFPVVGNKLLPSPPKPSFSAAKHMPAYVCTYVVLT